MYGICGGRSLAAAASAWNRSSRGRGRERACRFLGLSLIIALSGCASAGRAPESSSISFPESKWGAASPRVASEHTPIPKGGGIYKIGDPYQVAGQWFQPRVQPDYDRVGIASWYGSDFHGRSTSNGEIYDMNALTAAHPTLPMPSYAYVTNMANGRTVLLRINDRGPYVANRVIDLSRGSAKALGLERGGTGRVRVRYAGPAPLDGNDARERQFLASRPWNGASRFADASPSYAPTYAPPAPQRTTAIIGEAWSPSVYRAGLASR